MRFLVAESEPPEARERRRESVGRSSDETYVDMLGELVPGASCDRVKPADADSTPMTATAIARYDAVFLTGSPLHVYDDTPEARRELDFMRQVFASGTPSFGSCAGLQVAAATAGGEVRSMGSRREPGSRGVSPLRKRGETIRSCTVGLCRSTPPPSTPTRWRCCLAAGRFLPGTR